MAQILAGLTTTAPVTLASDRYGNMYGVNGAARGFRYSGGMSCVVMGITTGATIHATASTTVKYYVSEIVVTAQGENYVRPPTIEIAGASTARASVSAGGVDGIAFSWSATTHDSAPYVSITGGQATGGVITLNNVGGVAAVDIEFRDTLYSDPPSVHFFANASGVTEVAPASARAVLVQAGTTKYGFLSSIIVTDPGQYIVGPEFPAGFYPLGATLSPAYSGAQPDITVSFSGIASTAAVSTAGTEYTSPPLITVSSLGPKQAGGGALVDCAVSAGALTAATVSQPGSGYDGKIVAELSSKVAIAEATIRPLLAGRYLCAVRYADSTPESKGGPNYGSISPTVEVNCGDGARSIIWSNLPTTSPDPSRITHLELWRTTGDEAITLYRVARYAFGSVPSSFTDSIPDDRLSTGVSITSASVSPVYTLPILTEESYPSAERFGIPPSDMAVVCFYQDRAWYGVSSSRPNTLCFSEVDEPESVPDAYEVTLQPPPTGIDSITGMFALGGALYVAQTGHMCRLIATGHPLESTTATYVSQRGMLNHRCFDVYDGIAYVADSFGLYAFDGNAAEPLSESVSTFWSDPQIDFFSSEWFSVQVDPQEKVVRFYHKQTGDSGTYPQRALCYSLVTKAWWTESYSHPIGAPFVAASHGQQKMLLGTAMAGAAIAAPGGTSDATVAIPYSIKTGNYRLNSDPRRGVRLTYTPTQGSHQLGISCYYNGSSSARPNAVATDVGKGVVCDRGSTTAVVDLNANRTSLQSSNGFVQMTMAGRIDDRSSGGDRDLAIELSGSQSGSKVIVHRMEIDGAGG